MWQTWCEAAITSARFAPQANRKKENLYAPENKLVERLNTEPASLKHFSEISERREEEAFLRSLVKSGLEYGVQVQEKNYQAINLTREQAHRTSCFDSLFYTLTLLFGIALS